MRVVRQVGNFAEVRDRDIAPLGAPRGLNAPCNEVGLHDAPPMR